MSENEEEKHERHTDRKRTLKGAHIAFNNGFSTVECIVKNISETGAYITVKNGILIPDRFELRNELDGFKVDCEIKWRKGNAFGAVFCGEKTPVKFPRAQIISHYTPSIGEEDESPETPVVEKKPQVKSSIPTFGKRR